jgi:hypothetical protein
MQTKTKTQRNRCTPMKAVRKPSTQKVAKTTTKTSCSSPKKIPTFRKSDCPKVITLTLTKTKMGYSIRESFIVNRVNQHASRLVPANVQTITTAINNLGII